MNTAITLTLLRKLIVMSCLLLLALGGAVRAATTLDEYTLKAVMVLNIAKFTTWPSQEIESGGHLLHICVYGEDSVQSGFSRIDRKVVNRGRSVSIRSLSDPADSDSCDIVFYGGNDRRDLSKVLAATYQKPVLTIGEMKGFTGQGGIFNMVKKSSKIQLELDSGNLAGAGLDVSSRLKKLCKIVGHR